LAFAFFFIGEYGNIILISVFFVSLLMGGSFGIYMIRIVGFILIRATLPRFRYDQLIVISWVILLPIMTTLIIFYFSLTILI